MTPLSRTLLATTGAALMTVTGLTTATTAQAAPRSTCTSSVPYTAGQDGYDTYRIPATVTTRKGTVLAFAEGRLNGAGDSGNIDVVLRRSTDGGCTWGPLSVVAAGGGDTRGNPAPVVDPKTGRIVLVTSYNDGAVTEAQIMRGEATPEQSRRVFVQTSSGTEDGRSFSPPRDITPQTKLPNWRWYATGPGHAVYLTQGPHTGRIVIPSNHSTAPPAASRTRARSPSTTAATRSTATTPAAPGASASSTTPTTASKTPTRRPPPNSRTDACTSRPGTITA